MVILNCEESLEIPSSKMAIEIAITHVVIGTDKIADNLKENKLARGSLETENYFSFFEFLF